ncbi:hypothetical protein EV421DRAFT_1741359 [Armillaria borealis]|uniref:Uncharacterized protein n=1 Tax=Armillaria borealis TaxID=47425 RepID=A0AA39MHI1_9AGAR|nr:hypothetical protein EV421DRAFT_1741359 [Armillaria borealis]
MKRSEDEHTTALVEWEANKNRKALSDPIEIQNICSGKTLGPGGQNFIDLEKVLYRMVLKKCYHSEDCQAMALPDDTGLKALEELGLGLKEYEAALEDEVEGPNTVGSQGFLPLHFFFIDSYIY